MSVQQQNADWWKGTAPTSSRRFFATFDQRLLTRDSGYGNWDRPPDGIPLTSANLMDGLDIDQVNDLVARLDSAVRHGTKVEVKVPRTGKTYNLAPGAEVQQILQHVQSYRQHWLNYNEATRQEQVGSAQQTAVLNLDAAYRQQMAVLQARLAKTPANSSLRRELEQQIGTFQEKVYGEIYGVTQHRGDRLTPSSYDLYANPWSGEEFAAHVMSRSVPAKSHGIEDVMRYASTYKVLPWDQDPRDAGAAFVKTMMAREGLQYQDVRKVDVQADAERWYAGLSQQVDDAVDGGAVDLGGGSATIPGGSVTIPIGTGGSIVIGGGDTGLPLLPWGAEENDSDGAFLGGEGDSATQRELLKDRV